MDPREWRNGGKRKSKANNYGILNCFKLIEQEGFVQWIVLTKCIQEQGEGVVLMVIQTL